MLKIKNISKTYKTGDLVQTALNGVSLTLRDNEFVAILGPSGSGKTTLLNIIGGLDRYDDGNLIINGVSTKHYKDRDWDTYRNHTIGFVFQSYNLIPHQTILANVELALTISGIGKNERKQRALKALKDVGLKEQAHKKPNQLSGGQMQRVAIARALVNNPSIVLADEPTGALDSKTSIQVMELLKEVAKSKLVVMVTHNPDLANEYANRIVKLQDGQIISDSNPCENKKEEKRISPARFTKARMNFLTALSLSFNNLLTKKGRTILTAFAGSIGIIGIALILSLSQGFQNYIDKIQEDTLSSYPLTITSDTADMTSAILSMVTDRQENQVEGENVYERQYLTTMFSSIGSNDLMSFKTYLEENEDEYIEDLTQLKYSYSVSPNIYSIDAADELVKLYPSSLWGMLYSNSASSFMNSFSSASGGMIFSEMTDDFKTVEEQYDVLKGRWPSSYDEMVIVLSEPNSISDLLVYSIGLRDTAELKNIIGKLMSQDEVDVENNPMTFTYDDLMNIDLRLVKATDTYKYNKRYDIYEDMSEDDKYMRDVYDKSLKLKIVGIVCANSDSSNLVLSPGVNFTSGLTQYVIDEAKKTSIVQKQLDKKNIDVFSGKSFDDVNEEEEEKLDFEEMIKVDEDKIQEAFKFNISEDDFADAIDTDAIAAAAQSVASNAQQKLADAAPTIDLVYTNGLQGMNMALTEAVRLQTSTAPFDITGIFVNFLKDPVVTAVLNSIPNGVVNKTNFQIVLEKQFDNYISSVSSLSGTVTPTALTVDMLETPEYLTAINTTAVATTLADTDVNNYKTEDIETLAITMAAGEAIGTVMQKSMSSIGDLFGEDMFEFDEDKFAEAFKFDMDEDELSRLMETMMSGTSEKTLKSNLISLGYQDVDDPTSISFYFKDFEAKENFLDFLDKYNEGKDEDSKIEYTDITGFLMSSVKTIVDSVTYVLIAFVSISLVVSSIMIAVITLISVMERTKEIGILRAMGASKKNVSSIFNAETFIIGFLSGLLGVGVTLFSIPFINALIHNLTGNYDINAVLPTEAAIILIIISVVLTIVAGLIPSRRAAKQDPVIALRSE